MDRWRSAPFALPPPTEGCAMAAPIPSGACTHSAACGGHCYKRSQSDLVVLATTGILNATLFHQQEPLKSRTCRQTCHLWCLARRRWPVLQMWLGVGSHARLCSLSSAIWKAWAKGNVIVGLSITHHCPFFLPSELFATSGLCSTAFRPKLLA